MALSTMLTIHFLIYMIESYSDYITEEFRLPHNPSSDSIGHGDWTLEAFFQQLDDPNCVEIIAIDCDFTDGADFDYLFSTLAFESIVLDAINRTSNDSETPIFVGLNASFTSGNANVAQAVDDIINLYQGFVIQSAPNVNSDGVPWGEYIPNVINVGAWNTDQNGYALGSNLNYFDGVDVFADGFVEENNWGQNFGTSFATPRVTAELINLFDEYLTPIISNPDYIPPEQTTLSQEELTVVTDGVTDAISTDVDVV